MSNRNSPASGFGAVALIGPAPPPFGGMALQSQALSQQLAADSIAVHWLPTNPRLPGCFNRVKGLRTVLQSGLFLLGLLRVLPRVAVVHIFAASYLYFFIRVTPAVLLGRLLGKQILLNYRGGAAPEFFARCGWVAWPIVRLAHIVTVPSAYLERCFAPAGVPCRIVPNLVNLERFRFRKRGILQARILVNRNLEPMYNVAMALRAFAIIKRDFPAARLEVAGSGSQEGELKAWVAEHDLPDVIFHGAVANERMPELLDGVDILVNPTRVDNLPMSLLEACASGVAVVSTNVGGIPDLVAHERSALLVESDDHLQMAAEIRRLLTDPQLATRLIAAGRNLSEKFDWPAVRRELLAVYYPHRRGADPDGVAAVERP